ncbi:3-deoxy-D-arabino-heptulosonate 7-phosphate synthase [Bordetella sputigena]|uniref:3-deoxy-D-arabino-heptulosonate 7-phosphate synthase n=1 Tax=Bordetella sputigena TaxID=1416810 RepID=UPI0039EFA476
MSRNLLDQILREVPRRYRLPPLPAELPGPGTLDSGTELAMIVERIRTAPAAGPARAATAAAMLKAAFIDALARLIRDAMREDAGDPVFQAMVLRHRTPRVREYASLSAHADRDRREVLALVNGVAHPAKQARRPRGPLTDALAELHALAAASSWRDLHQAVRRLVNTSDIAGDVSIGHVLTRLAGSPALIRLDRLEALARDDDVRRYRALWDMRGPRSGSAAAAAHGSASQRRGAAVEARAAQALGALARRLDREETGQDGGTRYRVATSMRVPAFLSAGAERAKTEWDVVLLRQSGARGRPDAGAKVAEAQAGEPSHAVWDVRLWVEAKASLDAATTDLPRLVRGLRLLAGAEENVVYPFLAREGIVAVFGASLRGMQTHEAALRASVLYCCDAPMEIHPRFLSAASRMQLLSAPASLAFADRWARGRQTDPEMLEPVWRDLTGSARWTAVLHQYAMLRQVRELLVHVDDVTATVASLV